MESTLRPYRILSKRKSAPLGVASIHDFQLQEIAGKAIEPDFLLQHAGISLYCLDPEKSKMVFVETPLEVDLTKGAFYYAEQYKHASAVFTLSYEGFIELCRGSGSQDPSLVFVYSVGRSGSTLLKSLFNEIESCSSFSEYDVFTQLTVMREWDGSKDELIQQLLEASVRFMCRKPLGAGHKWVFKHRSFTIELADLLTAAFPSAKNIFLYRNAVDYLKSAWNAFAQSVDTEAGSLEEHVGRMSKVSPLIAEFAHERKRALPIHELGALMWLSVMESCLVMQGRGIDFLGVRYEELIEKPKETLVEILNYCEIYKFSWQRLWQTFNKDSQDGSVLSRAAVSRHATELPKAFTEHLELLLKSRPVVREPGFEIPNTAKGNAF